MTRAQLIGSSSLLIAIPYFLLAPNWTHAGFVWIDGTVILLVISTIGFSFHILSMAEPYIRLKALNHLQKGYILIFARGNGQPLVSSDYPVVQLADAL
ncbi:hypothetical protein EVJ27_07550 [Exiguobacterium sp. SH3S2]|uniref:hypothetical protein n=1 Tax=unclassified Exiguobacterium TaxID=2644629 RepID=UPI00103EDEEB|nr:MULTISPECIES: hypothetical protein [unclassified Exiguobacterium]TCI45715.1 hypothetical protein EVJ28_07550 [Exiguobacterium sp. SH3S3]TCI60129.1 hypothetical protein EVJ26_11700 [Exiguobacterium sp. SH3S1]TCI60924.1 hypothetical protein EVJ27_07550 [Exiguobacterium sp. SH3S2]